MRFKVGDIVEGDKDGRWVMGRVAKIGVDAVAIYVLETKKLREGVAALHRLGLPQTEPENYWYIENAKPAKNYIIKQIIKDL